MSKEQTPITAEELFNEIWGMINDDTNTFSQLCLNISPRTILDIEDKIEKAFNTKVLEALEREFEGVSIYLGTEEQTTGKEYYETEVKPNYE
jgi:hypothetical protein